MEDGKKKMRRRRGQWGRGEGTESYADKECDHFCPSYIFPRKRIEFSVMTLIKCYKCKFTAENKILKWKL